MPIIFQEKVSKKTKYGEEIIFHLWIHSSDLSDEDEGCLTCDIRIHNKGKVIGEYYRKFLVRKYTKNHFYKFMDKFCLNKIYREQFNIIHEKTSESYNLEIDAEIKDIIKKLNSIDLKTNYSCQGTKTSFSDRPKASDGHSILSYISFKKSLPLLFLKILNMYDLFLDINSTVIYSKKRKFNIHFKDIMEKVIDEYILVLSQQNKENK